MQFFKFILTLRGIEILVYFQILFVCDNLIKKKTIEPLNTTIEMYLTKHQNLQIFIGKQIERQRKLFIQQLRQSITDIIVLI